MPNRAPTNPHARSVPSVLIAAGPTHEPVDAVRYIANRSSGRLGLALADAARQRHCPTTLLIGPGVIPHTDHTTARTRPANADPGQAPDSAATVRRFRTSADLEVLLLEESAACDVLIMAAAVADYRPATVHAGKLPRTGDSLSIELEPVPDLLAMATKTMKPGGIAIGFALEENSGSHERSIDKMARKACHAIVLNPLATMDSAAIDATILFADGSPPLAPGPLSKEAFAHRLIEVALDLWAPARGTES
ncbi:MAG: phosphopantothenoylcysteine decarboxylase [Phycisphaerales bacterium JB060]